MDPQKMMGVQIPGDQKILVPARDWEGMKRALWRSQVALQITLREALLVLQGCRHRDGCPGIDDETEPCFTDTYTAPECDDDGNVIKPGELQTPGCPDREARMSALVIINAARQLAPVNARNPGNAPFYAPSREYFSEIMATLAATQIENDALREALRSAGVEPPVPHPQIGETS